MVVSKYVIDCLASRHTYICIWIWNDRMRSGTIRASTEGHGQETEDDFPDSPDPDDPEDSSSMKPLIILPCTISNMLLFTCGGDYIKGYGVQIYVRFHESSVVVRHGGAGGQGCRREPVNIGSFASLVLICGRNKQTL